jgi:enoyl-CoA hydratase/carnithine racemase
MSVPILLQRDGGIATVTLNTPEKMNALNLDMWRMLGEYFTILSDDDDVRCIVLRGAGEQAFSAGADIEEFPRVRHSAEQSRAYSQVTQAALQAIADCRHPTVALIQGACVGGGLEMSTLCDLRICGASSRFGVPINRLGLVVSHEELRGLMALVGRAGTLEILLEGRVFGADQALRMGLVNRVVPDGEVVDEVAATARRISHGAPLVARWHKKFLRRLEDPAPLTEAERDEAHHCFDTEDFRIGYRAFLDKARPAFQGR